VLKIDKSVRSPKFSLDGIAGYELPRTACEQRQQTKGLRRQFDFSTMLAEFTGFKLEFKGSKAYRRVRRHSHNLSPGP